MLASLNACRERRVRAVGQRVCAYAIPLCLFAALVDYRWGRMLTMPADLLTASGCLLSLVSTRVFMPTRGFAWLPAYTAFFVSNCMAVYSTGGVASPFLPFGLAFLLVAGIGLQSRFSVNAVFVFAFSVLFAWVLWSELVGVPPYQPVNFLSFGLKCLAYLSGIFVCLRELLRNEESMATEAASQAELLAETRENLIHTAKIAELGNLISATAHELAQPTQVISGHAALMARRLKENRMSREELEKFAWRISDASSRMASLLRDLQNFSRKEPFRLQELDLTAMTGSVLNMIKHDQRTRHIEITLDTGSARPRAVADEQRLQQILLNLLNNARDAASSDPQGWVRLTIRERGSWARIVVSNSGDAIPLDAQGKLFQKYYTTKEKGRGTGLGLSICAQLTNDNHGRLFFCSEPGQTKFVLDLPTTAVQEIRPQATA